MIYFARHVETFNCTGNASVETQGLSAGFSHSGNNDAWIRDSTSNWNAITQIISVQTHTNYTLAGWVQNNFTSNIGYFGVRDGGGINIVAQTPTTPRPAISNSP